MLNQVQLTYNTFGQLIEEQQEHAGAVSGSTPSVQYGYDSGGIRLQPNPPEPADLSQRPDDHLQLRHHRRHERLAQPRRGDPGHDQRHDRPGQLHVPRHRHGRPHHLPRAGGLARPVGRHQRRLRRPGPVQPHHRPALAEQHHRHANRHRPLQVRLRPKLQPALESQRRRHRRRDGGTG